MGCIASHIYHTQYFCSDENSLKPRIHFVSRSNTLLHQHLYFRHFLISFFAFICYINYLIRCPFGYLFARTSGNYRRAAYAVTTPYQTSDITIPSACNSKVYGAPSTELHYMGYYPLTAFDFPFTRLVPCISLFIFRSLELLI